MAEPMKTTDHLLALAAELETRNQKLFKRLTPLFESAYNSAVQDEVIIVRLAIRPLVTIRLDAGPERLDAIKN